MADVGPPARLQSLDAVRGIAVMGILLLNIVSFAMPEPAYYNPRAYGGAEGSDLAVYLVNFVLFDGKMRGLFSFLFGASMLLVIGRAEAAGRSAAEVHYARMAWLLLFGLAHLWLVWDGDILAHYALVGMIAFAMRSRPTANLIILGTMLAAFGALIFATLPLTVVQHPQNPHDLAELNRMFGTPDVGRDLALHRGTYAEILSARFGRAAWYPLKTLLFVGCETLAYMLFGMAALRSGMLRGEWPRRRYRKWLLISWGVALPAYAALAAYLVWAKFSLFSVTLAVMALATPFRPLMIAGWICLILLMIRGGAVTARIAAAGRMAFTNYLATSLICTTLFYGYGLGWYGQLTRWQLYPLVLAVWALMLLWSKPWLDRFAYGPLEWLWRSLARGRLQPMRRQI